MILTFGEILLRLSPQLQGVWLQKAEMPVFLGGAELNVATALGQWGVPVAYCSALPDNEMGRDMVQIIKKRNISTDKLIFSNNRIGIYYIPQGADLKNAGVIYDRAASGFSLLKPDEIDWNKLFENVNCLQMSAISPALTQETAALCIETAKQAKLRGITVAFDLNYRSKLWKYRVAPIDVISEIVPFCDVLMGNIWSAEVLLGISLNQELLPTEPTRETYLLLAEKSSKAIKGKFPNVQLVANTFRFDLGSNGIQYFAALDAPDGYFASQLFESAVVVDKIGSGDCFMAGLLYGLFEKKSSEDMLNFATSAAFGKLHEQGDSTRQTVSQIMERL